MTKKLSDTEISGIFEELGRKDFGDKDLVYQYVEQHRLEVNDYIKRKRDIGDDMLADRYERLLSEYAGKERVVGYKNVDTKPLKFGRKHRSFELTERLEKVEKIALTGLVLLILSGGLWVGYRLIKAAERISDKHAQEFGYFIESNGN